ncbi:16S rRNA uridine-516 pseudouridylate synthase [Metamycoplasma auris 15026]|uniref:Pseudouridine synthase n=1 Tax=Metamycoplasma auris 15026 TaxID=1188233 RepID=N9TT15_9BACT|nr:pseudouridine synthase [Metamycoplasma auris]ENY69294.1 16S rRNA uridine-516 pseudouridylate synthase [Metamycoplasma auris 15026]
MKIRIEKIIALFLGISRLKVKKIIRQKRISINDEIIDKPILVNPEVDIIKIDNEIVSYEAYSYYLFNKPSGYITSNFDTKNQTIFDILPLDRKKFFAYGRLDKDTEGLLIISNDGKVGHQIMNSKFQIEKKYYFEIDSIFDDKIKKHYPSVIKIENDYLVTKYKFEFINESSGYLSIYEGKFHQVKQMLKFFGFNVTYLKRIKIGNLSLENLELGQLRKISKEELMEVFN